MPSEPSEDGYHSYFDHHHLRFDREAGQREFRDTVNRLARTFRVRVRTR